MRGFGSRVGRALGGAFARACDDVAIEMMGALLPPCWGRRPPVQAKHAGDGRLSIHSRDPHLGSGASCALSSPLALSWSGGVWSFAPLPAASA